ncbi:Pentapeptide repeat protein (fragment) [metagenome]|uniref:Pentapeptide repeat protein n=1 Tax=metagenome TaxID=256318 RepID=A0A2P2BYZ2_9ZZZZ
MTELRADCASCAGLCCVALRLTRSADFPVDKPAGEPCEHLETDLRCGIHDTLRDRGYRGCTVFDCFGAGQAVTRAWVGPDWREDAEAGRRMFAVFGVVRALHELSWLLERASRLPEASSLAADLDRVSTLTRELAAQDAASLAAYDVTAHRGRVNALLRQASALARAGTGGPELSGADLVGRDLRSRVLVGAGLRGALLTGADLRGLDLSRADVTGADLRAADLRGTDLRETLFVSQAQLDAARGDASTRLPLGLGVPSWWTADG